MSFDVKQRPVSDRELGIKTEQPWLVRWRKPLLAAFLIIYVFSIAAFVLTAYAIGAQDQACAGICEQRGEAYLGMDQGRGLCACARGFNTTDIKTYTGVFYISYEKVVSN